MDGKALYKPTEIQFPDDDKHEQATPHFISCWQLDTISGKITPRSQTTFLCDKLLTPLFNTHYLMC